MIKRMGPCMGVSLCLAGFLWMSTQIALGGSITITNNSFELEDGGDGGGGQATGWNTWAALSGVFDPLNAQFSGTTGDNVQGELPHGGQCGNVWWEPWQNLGVAAAIGATYTLNFYIGWRRDFPEYNVGVRVQLLEGTNAIINQVVTPTAVGFAAAAPLSGVATGNGTLTLKFIRTNTTDWQHTPLVDLVTLTENKPIRGTVIRIR